MAGKHIFLTGRVQGVGLRFHTHEKARELGLKGWVRNLANGKVEILAFGQPSALKEFLKWIPQATSSLQIENLESVDVEKPYSRNDFFIRRDKGPTWEDS